MRTYEALAASCRRQGVDVAFGLVGDGNVKFVQHLTGVLGVDYVAVRHESAAVTMASGYARASGRTAFATVTQGPGLTNAMTALTAAAKARLPVVLFAGLPPTGLPGHPQAIDQQALLAVAGTLHQPLRPDHLDDDVAAAFALAAAERRPVGMFLATDVQDAPLPPQVPAGADAPSNPSAERSAIEGPLDEVAACLLRAERPLLVAGRGCLASPHARERILSLADHTGALVATTLPIRGYFAGHPYAVGVLGGYASALAVTQAEQADLVIGFGTSLNYRSTRSGTLLRADATVVQVDLDPAPPGASVAVDLALTGDAGTVAGALDRAVRERSGPRLGARTDALARRLREGEVHDGFTDLSPDGRIDPRVLMHALDRMLPAGRSVTVDGGHSSGFPSVYLDVPDEQGYLFALEFAAIGLGLGTAMGAAVARPERLSVLVVGDGSLLMSLPDLETAVRHGIPLVIVVMNDHAYTSELAILANDGLPPDLGRLATPSFAAVAQAMGARAITVRRPEDLAPLGEAWSGLDGPYVVDALIDPDVRGPWLKGAFNRTLELQP